MLKRRYNQCLFSFVAVRRGEVQATFGQDQMGSVRARVLFGVRRPVVPQVVREREQTGHDRERVRRGQHVHSGATSGRRVHRLRRDFRVSRFSSEAIRSTQPPDVGWSGAQRATFLGKVSRGKARTKRFIIKHNDIIVPGVDVIRAR